MQGTPSTNTPGKVQTITILMLINGILNILYGLGLTTAGILGSFGIALLCAPVLLLPTVLGVFEVIYASRLLSIPHRPAGNLQTIAILEICNVISGNGVSLIAGVLNLVFLGDPEVKAYLSSIPGGNPTP